MGTNAYDEMLEYQDGQRKSLPEYLKKMRGILAGVKDENDDRLNYLLEKNK